MPKRPKDVLALAAVLIVFGLGEVWVGAFGNYLGILAKSIPPSPATAIVGSFYCLGGLVLLVTRRICGTILSLVFIGFEVLGRVYVVEIGIAPSRGPDLAKIVIGGLIAIGFMLYLSWRSFRRSSMSGASDGTIR